MDLHEEHGHSHEDDLVDIHIPGWALWAIAGILLGVLAVVAWDVYTQKRKAVKPVSSKPLLDMAAVEAWANKQTTSTVVQDEQPESPPL